MKQKNYTKRALCMSLLSMLLCCSMLIGTTFAWFTDSVTSGKNKIVAGNLDVELYHKNAHVTAPEDVTKTDVKLFVDKDGNEIKWEPGMAVYETFTVKNAGSLALKYELALSTDKDLTNTVVDADGTKTDRTLADVLKIAVIKGENTYDTRDDMIEAVKADSVTLKEYISDETVSSGKLLPVGKTAPTPSEGWETEEESFTIILYWEPGTDDDLYNLKNGAYASDVTDPAKKPGALTIGFTVKVDATQVPYESDSFGSDYDKDIPLTDTVVKASQKISYENAAVFTFENFPEEGQTTTIKIPAYSLEDMGIENADAVLTLKLKDIRTEPEENREQIALLDIVLTIDGEEVHNFQTGHPATVTTYVEPSLLEVEVYSVEDGKQMQAAYTKATGELSFTTTHFSSFAIYKLTGTDAEKNDQGFAFRVGDGDSAQYSKDNNNGPIYNAPTDGNPLYLTGNYTYGNGRTNMNGAKAGANRVVDLNGHMLTAGYASLNTIGGSDTWKFTLRNGTFVSTSSGSYALYVSRATAITLQNLLIDRPDGNTKNYNYCGAMSLMLANSADANTITLDGVNAANGASSIYSYENDTVTLNNSQFHWNKNKDKALYLNGANSSTLTMKQCIVDGNAQIGMTGTVTISDTDFTGEVLLRKTVSGQRMEATFEGCTINGTLTLGDDGYSNAYVHATLKDVTINGSVKVSTKKTSGKLDANLTIVSGTYSFDPQSYLAEGSTATQENGVWVVTAGAQG